MLANVAHRGRACVVGLAGGFLFSVLTPLLMAQGTGQLRGKVTDSTGAPVGFALVTTTNVETGNAVPTATGPDGTYSFSLAPGNYRIAFKSAGYETVAMPATRVGALWAVVRNCEFDENAQAQRDPPVEPQQQTAPQPSNNPQEPSLQDLGITPSESKGSAQAQALLDKRSHMLKVHQRLGLITIAPFAATLVTSAFAGGRQTSSTTRDLHAALGATTVGMYFTTAYFAIRAPKISGTKTRGPIRLHKTLAWVHGPGMVLTPILGEMAFAQKSNGQRIHGLASLHGPAAIATASAFGLAVASVSFKF
jgi:hypothetical protein